MILELTGKCWEIPLLYEVIFREKIMKDFFFMNEGLTILALKDAVMR